MHDLTQMYTKNFTLNKNKMLMDKTIGRKLVIVKHLSFV